MPKNWSDFDVPLSGFCVALQLQSLPQLHNVNTHIESNETYLLRQKIAAAATPCERTLSHTVWFKISALASMLASYLINWGLFLELLTWFFKKYKQCNKHDIARADGQFKRALMDF